MQKRNIKCGLSFTKPMWLIKNCMDWTRPQWLITVVYNSIQCVSQALTFPFAADYHPTVCSGWPSELASFAHVVYSPPYCLLLVNNVINWLWVAYLGLFLQYVCFFFEELESHGCSHCHLQAPSGVDAIKWTDLL